MAFKNLTLYICYFQKKYNIFVANKIKDMERIYEFKIHDITRNRIYVYKTLAISLEDAYLQAKVLHSHYINSHKKKAELKTNEL